MFEYSLLALMRLLDAKQVLKLLSAVLLERQVVLTSNGISMGKLRP